jgi:deazaflavin-dependent oxidoreductase (nitroreductase family)
MRFVLGLRVATPLSRRLMLVFLTGRRTGKVYRQPVSYVRHDDTLLTPGGGRWTLNLADGKPVRIRLRGRDVVGRPELVSDIDEVDRLLGIMMAANPGVRAFVRIPRGPDGHLDRDRLEAAIQHGFRIVRWHLDEPGQ